MPEVTYDADALVSSTLGYWVTSGLGDDAVAGVRVDVVALAPGPPPLLAQTWVAQFDDDFPRLVSEYVTAHLHRLYAERERRDSNAAMLLWGVHL